MTATLPPMSSPGSERWPGGAPGPYSATKKTSQPRLRSMSANPPAKLDAWGFPALTRKPNRIGAIMARRACEPRPTCLRLHLVENRDAETVEFSIRALRHDLVDDPSLGIVVNPASQYLTKLIAVLRLGSRKNL